MTSVVYFLRGEVSGAIKIGFSKRLSTRLSNILTSSSEVVTLIGAVQGDVMLEKTLHDEFAADRIQREWFRPSDALLARIASLLESGAVAEIGVVRPAETPDDPFTQQAVKWLIAIEDGEYLRRNCNRDITRKRIAKRLNCSATSIENLRYGRKRTPISARDHQAMRAAFGDELLAQADDLTEMLKYVPAHIAASVETQLAAARELLSGEVR